MKTLIKVVSVLLVAIVAGLVGLGLLSIEEVKQTHFSLETLVFRSTAHYESGLFNLRVTPIEETQWSTDVLDFVRLQDFDLGEYSTVDPWVFVSGRKSSVRGWQGDGRAAESIFTDPLWLEWSQKNPMRAAEFWPILLAFFREATQEMPGIVNEVPRIARTFRETDASVSDFRLELSNLISGEAYDLRVLGDDEKAERLDQWALRYQATPTPD